ncbi:MAG: hypothetical protein K2J38_03570 [Muribaculaceae bacterium]|nr:hypothetical protein [Muribaculaceae bacterium]
MKIYRLYCILLSAVAACPLQASGESHVISTFNPSKVILPSSQYTPDEPYTADVWVYNDGRRYDSAYYNQVLGEPVADSEGRLWYEPSYVLTDSEYSWQKASAPFSSDEYYKGHRSFRWCQAEIMGEMYMRRTFALSSLPAGSVYLACGHDDGPSEWYINGVQVHTVADGWNNDEYILLSDEQKALLKTDGTPNVLAVHVHQNWGGAFADCGLYEADMTVSETLLHTVAESGPWPCKYYLLNYNDDIATAEECEWYSVGEDESDWINGSGPFSNDANMFYITEWPSQVRPILVRRHFTLDDGALADITSGSQVILTCSYDENPVIYLNGTRIWSASGWNDNNYAEITLDASRKALLRQGDNVLAASLTQGGGGGHIDYGLKIVRPFAPSGISLPQADHASSDTSDRRIYNLQGQYLGTSEQSLAKGIYIRGGKKLILGH